MNKEQSENLDKILNRLIEVDSVISINDFQDENGNYFGFKENENGENYFKNLLPIFDEFGIANIDLTYLELTPIGSEHIRFKNNGGFKEYYNKKEKNSRNIIDETKREKDRKGKQDWVLNFDRKWKKPLAYILIIGLILTITFNVINCRNGRKSNSFKKNTKDQQENTESSISKEKSKKEEVLKKKKDTIEVETDSLPTEHK